MPDFDHRAAVKLALKTKRLPVTAADEAARADQSRPLYERHSSGFSGIPLADYFAPYASECGFSTAALEIARFLVANRRAFKELAETGMSDDAKIEEFVRCCGDEMRLRALYVFTCADRALWESESAEPARWWSIREIHQKAVETFHPDNNRSGPLLASGCGKEELAILQDIGEDFFSGAYRLHVLQLGSHLVRLARKNDSVGPKVDVARDGTSPILRVAARDYRGLAASITGALWHSKVEPVQAHLFSAMNHGLALDFFHLALGNQPPPQDLATNVAEAIHTRLHIADADEATLPEIDGRFTLTETRPGLHCLRFETIRNASGLIYALTYKVFRHLQGNIHALKAHTTRDHTYISIYYSPPLRSTLEEARAIVEKRFGNMLR